MHARQQAVAMLDTEPGKVVSMTLKHQGNRVREFYSSLPRPVRVGSEATGSIKWFVNLIAAEPKKQKQDRRDADLIQAVGGKPVFDDLASQELQVLRSSSYEFGHAKIDTTRISPWSSPVSYCRC